MFDEFKQHGGCDLHNICHEHLRSSELLCVVMPRSSFALISCRPGFLPSAERRRALIIEWSAAGNFLQAF